MKIISANLNREFVDKSFWETLKKANEGRFWHWQRSYALENTNSRIYIVCMNLFERIYAHLVGMESYLKKACTDHGITFMNEERIRNLTSMGGAIS